ncbi:MAG: hypothetical protein HUJ51_02190 [Eggerthellaceae bacterium]|nr:hypothetical protein [Eggerthellaceae bacterium]
MIVRNNAKDKEGNLEVLSNACSYKGPYLFQIAGGIAEHLVIRSISRFKKSPEVENPRIKLT